MELEWQLDFETGNEYVDLQHQITIPAKLGLIPLNISSEISSDI